MENDILRHRSAVVRNIMKSFGQDEYSIEKAEDDQINPLEMEEWKSTLSKSELDEFEKAKHQDGDMHPNGKWVWRQSANGGKGDWRVANPKRGRKSAATATASQSSSTKTPTQSENSIYNGDTIELDNLKKVLSNSGKTKILIRNNVISGGFRQIEDKLIGSSWKVNKDRNKDGKYEGGGDYYLFSKKEGNEKSSSNDAESLMNKFYEMFIDSNVSATKIKNFVDKHLGKGTFDRVWKEINSKSYDSSTDKDNAFSDKIHDLFMNIGNSSKNSTKKKSVSSKKKISVEDLIGKKPASRGASGLADKQIWETSAALLDTFLKNPENKMSDSSLISQSVSILRSKSMWYKKAKFASEKYVVPMVKRAMDKYENMND